MRVERKDAFARLREVWTRVGADAPRAAGAAKLKPRREGKSRATRFLPPAAPR